MTPAHVPRAALRPFTDAERLVQHQRRVLIAVRAMLADGRAVEALAALDAELAASSACHPAPRPLAQP